MSNFDLSGKTAIITGGNGGIGKGIALGLAAAGADIAIAARNEAKTAGAVAEIEQTGSRCLGIRCDVTCNDDIENAVRQTLAEFGHIDILVNNAGTAAMVPAQQMTEAQWDDVLHTNLKADFIFAQNVYPSMVEAGGGKIINIGSMMSIFGDSISVAYSVSKGGVVQLTKSLAISWAPDNIQVNAICPGWLLTDLTIPFKDDVEFNNTVINRTPAKRFGLPEDVAGTAVFLASSASDFVTGQSIAVDGGFSISAI